MKIFGFEIIKARRLHWIHWSFNEHKGRLKLFKDGLQQKLEKGFTLEFYLGEYENSGQKLLREKVEKDRKKKLNTRIGDKR